MEIEEQKQGSQVILAVKGRLDGITAPGLEERIASMVERSNHDIVLDCSGMDYVSSAGLRAVLISARACQQKGGKLVICDLTETCKTAMEATGFLTIIAYFDNRDAALASKS